MKKQAIENKKNLLKKKHKKKPIEKGTWKNNALFWEKMEKEQNLLKKKTKKKKPTEKKQLLKTKA